MPEPVAPGESSGQRAGGCLDRLLLFGVAVAVCAVGGVAFWLADAYHVSPWWVFFLWNTVFLVPLLIRDFKGHLKKPVFVAFLAFWGIFHGVAVTALMRWTPFTMWLLGIFLELFVGFILVDRIFGIRRPSKDR